MTLQLPERIFKAYLFDCDGTIADSMPLHYKAWKKALGEWSCEFEEKLFYAWGGMPVVQIISTLNERHGLNMPVERVSSRKESLYFELLPQLKAVPDVLVHIEAAHGRIPLAVVSGSTKESVSASLAVLKLLDRFDTMVCAGDYKKSKPNPEAFLLAAASSGWRRNSVWYSKTPRWAFRRRRPQAWPPLKFRRRGKGPRSDGHNHLANTRRQARSC
jgi:beta-phosphoglucomutase-like phosphatase (HAD superfamily)